MAAICKHLHRLLFPVLLCCMVGFVTSYFPGLTPDEDLAVMCQNAQEYKAGGKQGTGEHGVNLSPTIDSYIPGHKVQRKYSSKYFVL